MSTQLGKVVSLILLERFGEYVETVGSCLFKKGICPLQHIRVYTQLPASKVKESLCILIKYGLVNYEANHNRTSALYTIQTSKILLMLRYPKYIRFMKTKFGDEAEIILEELLQSGYCTVSDLIIRTYNRMGKDDQTPTPLVDIRDKIEAMITARYLMRIKLPKIEEAVPELVRNVQDMYKMPEVELSQLSKKQSGEPNVIMKDTGIFWQINHDRFHEDMRDKLIESAIENKFDASAAEIIRVMLQQMYIRTEAWADTTNPIPILEVKDIIKKLHPNSDKVAFFDNYINIIEQDSSNIIRKAGEASGGSFQIQMKDIFTQLTWETIQQIVLEKFDSKAARIFCLVKNKSYIEPDQIQKMAMIPAKESKKLTYELLEENFLQVQELKKAPASSGPAKSFILFHIDLSQVVRMVLELCYKSLYNILTRRNHEKIVNKRLIDKKHRVDTIALSMKTQGASEEQLGDIDEMITPPEKEMLTVIEGTMRKLNTIELEIDETIFLLNTYLAYE
ncbi:PREDICTED: DNA-directed RNA polymerase III subunit RPC3 [Nicrophorus vespilloides]|uniref:DNA-directed RNA polymerase III subunit RPC3 n=1 Tax=Nicrophorus vespilloides TaxID=110193 RepID=A0ABM1NEI6_NICVS|nr:PREDICTED: DNA-directed RNA polymerase III subunit RPC3 [Nicrophorus vespilloides]